MTSAERVDVAIAGAGPAGMALAAACAERGLATTVVAPRPRQPWTQTFGVWVDEAVNAGLDEALASRWTTTVVHARPGAPHRLARGYGLLDNAVVAQRLRERLQGAGGTLREGRVAGADGDGLHLSTGTRLFATAVVDATGHAPALVERRTPAAFQSAFGFTARFRTAPGEPDAMTLMDLRHPTRGSHEPRDPTFLYAADLGDGRWFVEETSLARRRPLPFDELERRLRARLERSGAEPEGIEGVERCVFPMGAALPERGGRVIPFGAAGGMVHPASGYQVGSALTLAPAVASALAQVLADSADVWEVTATGWDAVWGRDRRGQRALQQLGLEALLRFDQDALQRFFAAFFDLAEGQWRAYLSADGDAAGARQAMLAVFRRVGPLALPLVRVALGPGRRQLAEGLVAPRRPRAGPLRQRPDHDPSRP